MEKIPSTAALLDDLHRYIPVGRDRIHDGTTEKAQNVRLFGQIFKYLPELIRSRHSTISEAEAAGLERIILNARSQREMVYLLCRETRDILEPVCMDYLGHLQYQEIPQDFREGFTKLKKIFKKRLAKIRPETVSDQKSEEMREVHILQMLILGGIINVGHVSWSYFNAIPEVPDQDGSELDPSAYPETAQSVQSIIMNLVSCQDDVFHAVDQLMRRKRIDTNGNMNVPQDDGSQPPFYWHLYHPEDLRLDNGKLELSPTLIEHAKDHLVRKLAQGRIHLDEPRVGCGGVVLIPAIHQWCLRAAKQCLFPHMEHVKSLPVEIQDPPEETVPLVLQKKRKPKNLIVERQYRSGI